MNICVLSDILALLSILLCSKGERESALHVSFTLLGIRLEMFCFLSLCIFPEGFLFAVSALFCSSTDWNCLSFAKK